MINLEVYRDKTRSLKRYNDVNLDSVLTVSRNDSRIITNTHFAKT